MSALYFDTSYYVSQSNHGSTGNVESAFEKASWKFENYEVGLPEDKNGIGGFHVTQVSLVITQMKNKVANH